MTPPNIWNLLPSQSPSLRPMNIPAMLNANATTPIMLADIRRGSLNSANVIPTANASMLVAIASSVTSLNENSSLISSSSPDKLSRIIFNPIAKSNTNPIIDAKDAIMSEIVLMQ